MARLEKHASGWCTSCACIAMRAQSATESGRAQVVDMTDLQHIRLRIHEDPFTERENTLHYQCGCMIMSAPADQIF